MFQSRLRLAGALLAAGCAALVSASLAAGTASANDCSTNNVFQMGTNIGAPNLCNMTTALKGSGGTELYVEETGTFANARAVIGYASGASGLGVIGVSGSTNSTGDYSSGVSGSLNPSSPGLQTAGVFGQSFSTTDNGPGVRGLHSLTSGISPGVQGVTNSTDTEAVGVQGTITSTSPGVSSAAVRGINNGTGANGVGVWGSQAGSGAGVVGSTGLGIGIYGLHLGTSGTAPGVLGTTGSTSDLAVGVQGTITSTSPGVSSAAVRGINNGLGANGVGVWGSQAGSGAGVAGTAPSGVGVLGQSNSGWAGYFYGNVYVSGTLSKAAGAFKIDHPLDPAHKYLQHSFVESPQMMNVYNGNVTTNGKGFATVTLPDYFHALNRSFRYQLTIVGSRGWRARVVKEIADNRFTIQSDEPEAKDSWQVTGVRHDPYANAHRIKVVERKPAAEQNRYLHPELYGKSLSKRIGQAQLSQRQPSRPRAGLWR